MSQEICSKKFSCFATRTPSRRRRFFYLSRAVFILLVGLWAPPIDAGPGKEKDKTKDTSTPQRSERDKPALIREPEKTGGTAEGGADNKPPELNPARAEQSLEIGNYYFKRKRYDATIQRCKEAIQYKPDYWAAHKLLAKTYEKKEEPEKALQIYESYAEKFPTSGFVDECRKEIQRLQARGK